MTTSRSTTKTRGSELPRLSRRLIAVPRVSQRKGREGSGFMSPTQQKKLMADYCERTGDLLVLDKRYDETDSVSGRTTNRVGLQAALADIHAGKADGLIVAKVNRFSRNLIEGLLAVDALIEAGKSFVAVDSRIDSGGDKLGREGEVLLTFLLMMAKWELEDLTSNWADVRHRHVANGVSHIEPYGYKLDKDRHLVKAPREAKVVARIFELRAAGRSWAAIAREMEARKAPRPKPRRGRRAKPGQEYREATVWTFKRVKAIVENRVYLGELRHGDAVKIDAHEAIVSPELWRRANTVTKTAAKSGKVPYLLTGLVRCASCGGRMGGLAHRVKGTNRQYFYYRCRVNYGWGTCPQPARIGRDELDELVLADFVAAVEQLRDRRATPNTKLPGAQRALAAAEAELEAFTDAESTAYMRQQLGQDYVDRGMRQRTDAVVEARAKVEQLTQQGDVSGELRSALPAWDDMDVDDQRHMLAHLITVVAVAPASRTEPLSTADRYRLWTKGQRGAPKNLPGWGGTSEITPIDLGGRRRR
jgi:site-specific DNA recombinase